LLTGARRQNEEPVPNTFIAHIHRLQLTLAMLQQLGVLLAKFDERSLCCPFVLMGKNYGHKLFWSGGCSGGRRC